MRKKIEQEMEIPEGIICTYDSGVLKCQKGSVELEKELYFPGINIQTAGKKIKISCGRANKNHHKIIMSFLAHIRNVFHGLNEKFVYELEAVNVHFPMAIKSEGNKVSISNFFGEKVPRYAIIMPNVEVEIKGQKITITSHDKEAAGQTAANLEKATRVKGRDKRIFQDGIYIISKPRREA